MFQRLDYVSVFSWYLLSCAHYMELGSVSGTVQKQRLDNYHNPGHNPSSCLLLQHNVSQTGFYLRLQADNLCLRT
jgi:hypothetical protein